MKKLFFLTFILFSIQSYSQSTGEKELGVWYMYNGTHKLSDKFSLKTMAHFRFFEVGDDLQQFITRLGVNYKINKNLSVTVGHAFLNTDGTFDQLGGDAYENRTYEDFNVKHSISKLGFAHRLRAEQRFFESGTGHFLRYQLGLSYPIDEKWSTYLYDEIFMDFDGENFNQNWLGAGFKYKLSKVLKLQLGYMKITDANDRNFDRIQIGVALNH
ncbi:DUF2490 domain-containing protein [uncultured Tenacibaculum sp.]|uniref:DUF2490 domain-containing protein n=1 Tax=uncultured Tenacibaculum sp. TaxID=174713 RepID=UPI002629EE63|nr:DUF2490 domain-containing protein [uncultured Tenacibaculum sp.]